MLNLCVVMKGNSIGIGQYYVTTRGRIPEVIDNICLGNQYEYNNITGKDVELKDVVNLLKDGHIVALYQKGCEAGPRALGNRSLLLNPTIKNGKDIMNTVKQRESFRPFACSILHEEMNEWFDMSDLKESQYMMYAVQSKKSDIVPSIVHNDNTCRVQTVKENQNKVLYDLLKLFNKETSIPLLMNTSFNLAGETLVETPEDAIDVLNRSKLEYLYFADIKKLVYIKNNK
jgi:carbamoyltransferase